MEEKKKIGLKNHVLIITSDAADAGVKQFRIRSWILGVIVFVVCVIIGALAGYLVYEERIWQAAIEKSNNQLRVMEQLQVENDRMKEEWEAQEEKLQEELLDQKEEIQILSTTLNQKVESEKALKEQLEEMCRPTGFPLNGSASSLEVTGDEKPVAKITTSAGILVVSTGRGTVISVNDDVDYGHNVWVDHGNGYVTVYRYQGDPTVKNGDSVFPGTTLFVVEEKHLEVGYQILLDGVYLNPAETMNIKG